MAATILGRVLLWLIKRYGLRAAIAVAASMASIAAIEKALEFIGLGDSPEVKVILREYQQRQPQQGQDFTAEQRARMLELLETGVPEDESPQVDEEPTGVVLAPGVRNMKLAEDALDEALCAESRSDDPCLYPTLRIIHQEH